MSDKTPSDRILLEQAFKREGIAYPAARLDEAVEDFSHLRGFLELIRKELRQLEVDVDE